MIFLYSSLIILLIVVFALARTCTTYLKQFRKAESDHVQGVYASRFVFTFVLFCLFFLLLAHVLDLIFLN